MKYKHALVIEVESICSENAESMERMVEQLLETRCWYVKATYLNLFEEDE